ncbi:hypothetical protein [Aliivibrio fischeri]|uniref:hypothetical protein n=1 Tax=Aliivibrio fischeri TaxID=668 RepID=UPI0007C55A7C|nr:hypothetical protein [Aliivibrio fischeri]MCE7575778.1 hypothetical protein [Aliivibrio fischeri]
MKNLLIYFLTFLISFLPVRHAWSSPLAAVVTLASNPVVRTVAADIVVDVIARGFAANDPHYKSNGSISKIKYRGFLKGNASKYSALVSILSAAGFLVLDGVLSKPESIPEGDVMPEKDVVWNIRSNSGATITEAAWAVVSGLDYIVEIEILPYKHDPSREDLRTVNYKLSNGKDWAGSGDTASRVNCQYANGNVSTCQPDFKPSIPSRPATDQEIDSEFFSYVGTLSNAEKLKLFSADDGATIYPELIPEIEPFAPPLLPNGSPLPAQGDELWTYADWINKGVAQKTDPNADYYVPPASWDTAYYLANTIAGSDSKVTDLNTGNKPNPDPNPDPDTGTGTKPTVITGVVEVSNLGGIESRIDTTNQTLESIENVLSDNFTQTKTPENDVSLDEANSFWKRKYPDGITGVFNKNLELLKNGELYQWISGFSIGGVAIKPHFEICLDATEYYDIECINLDFPDYIWTFLRAAMMFGAAIYCRRLIIG